MTLEKLKKLNNHKRDLRIKFDSENHIYSVDENKKEIYKTIEKKSGGNYSVLDEYKDKEDRILAESVKKLDFTFYDKDGIDSLKFYKDTHSTVEVEITMKINDNVDDALSTDVFLRNIYYKQQE